MPEKFRRFINNATEPEKPAERMAKEMPHLQVLVGVAR